MPMNRCTFFFKDSDGHGWTETFHNNSATLSQVITQALTVVPLRCSILGSSANLAYIRVSDDDVFRDSQVVTIPDAQGVGTFRGVSALADVCLLVRSTPNPALTGQVRKITYLRGLPKPILGPADIYAPISAWNAAFNMWAAEIINGFWSIKTINRLLVPVAITGAVQDVVTGLVTITTALGHGLVLGQGVNISGVIGAAAVNGRWNVQAVPDATHFKILLQAIMGTYVAGGTAKGVGFQLEPIFRVAPERTAERKAGRPFDSPVGRRRRRRSR